MSPASIAAEEQQKVLAAELSHRVKNTLAVVSSIAERTLPEGEAKTDLIGRFHALGHTHDLLSQCRLERGAHCAKLILVELRRTCGMAHVTMNGPPVMLKPQAALFFALVFHELATNAAKYGALSIDRGPGVDRLDHWSPYRRLELIWAEAGRAKNRRSVEARFRNGTYRTRHSFRVAGRGQLGVLNGGLHCRILIPANPQYIDFGPPPDRPIREEAAS